MSRWAFLRREDLRDGDGAIYLRRWRILETPWFGVLLHNIRKPDHDRDAHDHPWSWLTIALRGGYTEEIHDRGGWGCEGMALIASLRQRFTLPRRLWVMFGPLTGGPPDPDPMVVDMPFTEAGHRLTRARVYTVAYRQAAHAHRIVNVAPNTWTLVLRGRYVRQWGFWIADPKNPSHPHCKSWCPAQAYLHPDGTNGRAVRQGSDVPSGRILCGIVYWLAFAFVVACLAAMAIFGGGE